MDKLIKTIFEDECGHLDIDMRFIKRLHAFQIGFVNKNSEHIEFFGGHILGVHTVRFTGADENVWFEDILQASEMELRERVHKLPEINTEFVVSSDIFNISCVWLAHAIFASKKLTDSQREDAMIDVMLVMNYRFLTSRLSHYFRHPADPAVAEKTYSLLSNKFAIKQHKTWYNVLRNRAFDTITKTSLHYNTITKLDDNYKVVLMINDCQGRIRDMLKNIYEVFITTNNQGIKIASTTDVGNFDGAEILKDRVNGLRNYTQYIKSVLPDRNSFIKDELVTVTQGIVKTMPERLFSELLEWVSDNYGKAKTGIIEEVLDEILVHSFQYLEDNRSLIKSNVNLVVLLDRLRGVYTSSRSSDPVLLSIREKCEEIAFLATKNRNKNVLPSLRTGLMIYLVSRTFTKNHYS